MHKPNRIEGRIQKMVEKGFRPLNIAPKPNSSPYAGRLDMWEDE
jgi:hypothetical protein